MYSEIDIGNGLVLKPIESLGPKETDEVIATFCALVYEKRPNATLCQMDDSPAGSITYAVFLGAEILGVMALYDVERDGTEFTAKPMPIFNAPDDRDEMGRAILWAEVMFWFLKNAILSDGQAMRLGAFVLPIDNVEHRWTTRDGEQTVSILAALVDLGAQIQYAKRGAELIPIGIFA